MESEIPAGNPRPEIPGSSSRHACSYGLKDESALQSRRERAGNHGSAPLSFHRPFNRSSTSSSSKTVLYGITSPGRAEPIPSYAAAFAAGRATASRMRWC